MVPLLRTPSWVYIGLEGFFFTPIIGSCTVTFSSGCVTLAFLYRNPIGLMNRSYLTGRLVKSGPTNVGRVIILDFYEHCCRIRLKPKQTSSILSFAFSCLPIDQYSIHSTSRKGEYTGLHHLEHLFLGDPLNPTNWYGKSCTAPVSLLQLSIEQEEYIRFLISFVLYRRTQSLSVPCSIAVE